MRKMKQFIWDNIVFILILLGVLTGTFLLIYPCILPKNKEFEAGIAALVLYFGILYNILVYKISVDKFFKELFNEFNNRFNEMNEDLNNIRSGKFLEFEGSTRNRESIIIDYLNLCSEECYWFKKGRIDLKVWNSWKEGMMYYLVHQNFKEIVLKQKKEKDSYYGLYEELKL